MLSPRPRDARRDKVDKLQAYARFGVRFFWIVNPERRVLECLELGADGRYVVALTASAGLHTLTSFEGLTLDLDTLWAEIDALPDDAEAP